MEDIDAGMDQTAPAWAVFGDLKKKKKGAVVLLLVALLVMPFQLLANL